MTKLAALTTLLVFAPLVADSKPSKKLSVSKPSVGKTAVPIADKYSKPIADDAKPMLRVSKVSVSKPSLGKQAAPVPVDEDSFVDPVDARRVKLPAAPEMDDDYDVWKKKLTASQRQQVERFCRFDRPTDYEAHCGGIGIHRIPAPPPLDGLPSKNGETGFENGEADHAAWKASLSRVQRAAYEHLCSKEDNAFTQLCGATPLVVAFDNQTVAFTPSSAGPDWPTVATPWLAMDRDGDGAISSGAELFGDATVLSNGRTAKHGFDALASLDRNGDGRIDRADPMFASLVLWADRDGNRVSSPSELTPASSTIESIELGYTLEPRCDARLNCEREKSVMRYRDATGASRTGSIVDVYLHR